jgi:apolipoprotein N-acyltransferase
MEKGPDLIIWPESATPGYLRSDLDLRAMVAGLVTGKDTSLLIGSGTHAKIKREGVKEKRFRNSAFLVAPAGKIAAFYHKMILLPFAEYRPHDDLIPWPKWLVPRSGIFLPGRQRTVFNHRIGKFGVFICWESLFADHVRRFVKGGADFIVNLSNEAVFGRSPASRQLLSLTIFRAVENGVTVLRAANTGISCKINPLGQIESRVVSPQGEEIFVSGILTTFVSGPLERTLYTRYGNIFAIFCALVAMPLGIITLLPARFMKITSPEQVSKNE